MVEKQRHTIRRQRALVRSVGMAVVDGLALTYSCSDYPDWVQNMNGWDVEGAAREIAARRLGACKSPTKRRREMDGDPKFTLFWLDGRREVVQGRTIAEAMTLAGYGGGALRALDFYASGDNTGYWWEDATREWHNKEIVPEPA